MASKVERPIIFPLSNPTSRSEAKAEDLIRWTQGKALIATGSPFLPVVWEGKTYPIAQCNNVYIFPAVGLGLAASRATRVTDSMLVAAAEALGELSPALNDPEAPLLPLFKEAREVGSKIALAVAVQAVRDGVAPMASEDELEQRVRFHRWTPDYHYL